MMGNQKTKTAEQRRARRKVMEPAPKLVKPADPDVMVASIDGVDAILTLARGKVSRVTFAVDQGGNIDIPASLIRATAEMLDDVDGDR